MAKEGNGKGREKEGAGLPVELPKRFKSPRELPFSSAEDCTFASREEDAGRVLSRIREKLAKKMVQGADASSPALLARLPRPPRDPRRRDELLCALEESLCRSWDQVESLAREALDELGSLQGALAQGDGDLHRLITLCRRLVRLAGVGKAMSEFLRSLPPAPKFRSLQEPGKVSGPLGFLLRAGRIATKPRAPVRYHVDWPSGPFSYLEHGLFEVAGWAFAGKGVPAQAVWIEHAGKRFYCRRRHRPDVGVVHPEVRESPDCGFELSLVVGPGLHRILLKARWPGVGLADLGTFWVQSMGPEGA
jgi:hypothetical protein